MKNVAQELLVVGLRNAHAMERQAQELIERQIPRTDDYPEVQERLMRHLDETKQQLIRLEECLDRCGEDRSMLKDAALSTLGNMAAMAHAAADDEILKNALANTAFENYEISAYKSLLKLAELADVDLRHALTASLKEEQDMAHWCDANVQQITLDYVMQEEREAA